MANIKSQKKRIKTNEKARLRNRAAKAEMKTAVRRVREAVEAGDKDKPWPIASTNSFRAFWASREAALMMGRSPFSR